jgi:hypothetical protein
MRKRLREVAPFTKHQSMQKIIREAFDMWFVVTALNFEGSKLNPDPAVIASRAATPSREV